MSAQPSLFDIGYKINSNIMKRKIQQLLNNGYEIGFHDGYFTYDQPLKFIEEKKRIDQVIRDVQYGGRQHYLRFKVPDTWRIWERSG